jgi:hypothetical protein
MVVDIEPDIWTSSIRDKSKEHPGLVKYIPISGEDATLRLFIDTRVVGGLITRSECARSSCERETRSLREVTFRISTWEVLVRKR